MGVSAPSGVGGTGASSAPASAPKPQQQPSTPPISGAPATAPVGPTPRQQAGWNALTPAQQAMWLKAHPKPPPSPGGPGGPGGTPGQPVTPVTPPSPVDPSTMQYLTGTLGTPYQQNQFQQNPFGTEQAFSPLALNQFSLPGLYGGK